MKLQDQVCTQEQGQRLQELGITGSAIFWFSAPKSAAHAPVIQYGWSSGCVAPAFNSAELGFMLPERMKIGRLDEYYIKYHRDDEPFGEDRPLWFSEPIINNLYGNPDHVTEAIMKADLLIYLLQYNHITAEEANKRLAQ